MILRWNRAVLRTILLGISCVFLLQGVQAAFSGSVFSKDLQLPTLNNHRFYYYSPHLGRQTTTEPIGKKFQAGDINLYRYVGNGGAYMLQEWNHGDSPYWSAGSGVMFKSEQGRGEEELRATLAEIEHLLAGDQTSTVKRRIEVLRIFERQYRALLQQDGVGNLNADYQAFIQEYQQFLNQAADAVAGADGLTRKSFMTNSWSLNSLLFQVTLRLWIDSSPFLEDPQFGKLLLSAL